MQGLVSRLRAQKQKKCLGAFSALAKGDTDIDNIDGRFRAAYLFDFGAWHLKPLVDLDATRLDLDGTKEGGAGGASLVVKGNDQTYLSASPALQLGTQFTMANGTLIRPYVRGGATIFDETDFTLKASFAGTPKWLRPSSSAPASTTLWPTFKQASRYWLSAVHRSSCSTMPWVLRDRAACFPLEPGLVGSKAYFSFSRAI